MGTRTQCGTAALTHIVLLDAAAAQDDVKGLQVTDRDWKGRDFISDFSKLREDFAVTSNFKTKKKQKKNKSGLACRHIVTQHTHPLLLLNHTFLMDYCYSCCTSLHQTGDMGGGRAGEAGVRVVGVTAVLFSAHGLGQRNVSEWLAPSCLLHPYTCRANPTDTHLS